MLKTAEDFEITLYRLHKCLAKRHYFGSSIKKVCMFNISDLLPALVHVYLPKESYETQLVGKTYQRLKMG